MRAGEEVADHAVVVGLGAQMIADPHHTGCLLGRRTRQVDGRQAGGIELDRSGAWSHSDILTVRGRLVSMVSNGHVAPEVLQRSGRVLAAGGQKVAAGGRFVGGQLQRAGGAVVRFTTSGGAGESGLARLVHLQFLTAAGDAAVAVSLAGTLFFTLPTDQARPQVAQFLLLTMAPFAVVAPFIGPFLDRFRPGRRWAIGVTLALRGFLCWVLADAIADHSAWVFPYALGCLVASKAFTVTRASAVPRLLPDGFTLVNANSRISMANVVGAAVGGGIAAGIAQAGSEWSLRFGFVIFIGATVLAILLSPKVDSSAGERDIGSVLALPTGPSMLTEPAAETEASGAVAVDGRVQRRFRSLPPGVRNGLRCVMGARLMTGFLTFFLAFLLREQPSGNLDSAVLLASSSPRPASGTVSARSPAISARTSPRRRSGSRCCASTPLWRSPPRRSTRPSR